MRSQVRRQPVGSVRRPVSRRRLHPVRTWRRLRRRPGLPLLRAVPAALHARRPLRPVRQGLHQRQDPGRRRRRAGPLRVRPLTGTGVATPMMHRPIGRYRRTERRKSMTLLKLVADTLLRQLTRTPNRNTYPGSYPNPNPIPDPNTSRTRLPD